MKSEQTPTRSAENLTRRQKLLRRAVPLALLTTGVVGTGAYAAHEVSKDNLKPEAYAKAESLVTVSTEFGGSESGWTQGAAERALQHALYEGATDAFAKIETYNADGESAITTSEIKKIVDDLPTYDQAGQILEIANVGEIIPDKGDRLSVEVAVTVDSDRHVDYEVVDAQTEDISNNQQ